MKSLDTKIKDHAHATNARREIVEKDYALSYVLYGISQQAQLAQSLIFKGGTALKKIYFGDYRFSEDLDFSTINAPQGDQLQNLLDNAISISTQKLHEYGPFELRLTRKPERAPHPRGQEAFHVYVKFPHYNSDALCAIKLEITHDEPVLLPPVLKPIIHNYDENLDSFVHCYHIEEIIAEKLRSLLQTHEKLITRGWNRPRARDYYDLWRILKNHSDSLSTPRLINLLIQKCKHRSVSYSSIDDFFTSELVNEAQKHWKNSLHLQTINLPDCQQLLTETKLLIKKALF